MREGDCVGNVAEDDSSHGNPRVMIRTEGAQDRSLAMRGD